LTKLFVSVVRIPGDNSEGVTGLLLIEISVVGFGLHLQGPMVNK